MRWSYSLQHALELCGRRVAFSHVVASHNARDPERREAYLLRQIQSIPAWQGSLVHDVVAVQVRDALRWNRPIDPVALSALVYARATRQWAFSRARRYRLPGQSKAAAGDDYAALDVHERGDDREDDVVAAVVAVALHCFTNLAEQENLLALLRANDTLVSEVRLSLSVEGVLVAATPDLVAMRNGVVTIVDWKVSVHEESRHARQLELYAYLALQSGRWPLRSPHDILLFEVNLWRDHVYAHAFDEDAMIRTGDAVARGVAMLRTVLGDGVYAHLRLDKLPIAARPEACGHCAFASLCLAHLDEDGRAGDAALVRARLTLDPTAA